MNGDDPGGTLVKRHRLATRLWHWTNALAVVILLMSGLMISNAHPMLYWGHYGANYDQPWLRLPIFPGWATIPSTYNLALARQWHLFFSWIFAFGLLAYFIAGFRHLTRDLALSRAELAPRSLWADIRHHARLQFPTGRAALSYNPLQKLSYILVLFVLFPLMILTGLVLSPGLAPVTAWALDLLGGRQSARTIHFLSAAALALFTVVHLLLVLLAGPVNELRAITTGWFGVPAPRDKR